MPVHHCVQEKRIDYLEDTMFKSKDCIQNRTKGVEDAVMATTTLVQSFIGSFKWFIGILVIIEIAVVSGLYVVLH